MSAKKTVLIAEDDADDAVLLQEAFRYAKLDHQAVWVKDGQEVLDYLCGKPPYDGRRQNPAPDLLILDLKMPRLDGYGVLRWLRGQPAVRIPVVVLGSSVFEADKERTRELGAKEHYLKPLGFDDLVRLVMELDARWLRG